jgi:glycosyltransferase involved in cell wall biosynthesis
LLAHNFYKNYGGEDQVVENQLKLLSKKGICVKTYFENNKDINKNKGIGKIKLIQNSYSCNMTWEKTQKILGASKIDIAHIHNVYPIISPGIYNVLGKHNIPIIQTLHNYRFICPNGLMYTYNHICERCLIKNNYYECFYNKCYRKSYLQSFWYADIISRAYKKGYFNYIDRFIALTPFMKEMMIKKGFPASKISIIPNYVENQFDKLSYTKQNYFIYLGRLSEEKGIFTLLKAMENLNNRINLKIIGDGPLKEAIINFIREHKIQNIELLGFISGKEKKEFLKNAKAVIIPSECYENFPTVLLESFSLGTLGIVSKIGGVQYMINDSFNGLHFKPSNDKDLAEKILFINNNPDKMLEMSKEAYNTYLKNYTEDIFYERLINLYREVIEEKEGKKIK